MSEVTQADAVAIDRLRELAEAATPGPWADGPPAWFRGRTDPEDGKRPIQRPGHPGTFANVYGKENAAYIAAANPQAILSLITAYESQAERLREVEGAVVGDDELVADIDVAIGDSLDQGWLTRDGARAVVSMFKAYGWSVVRGVEK